MLDGHVGRQPAMVHGGGDGRTYSGVWPGGQAAENVLPNVCAVRSRRVRSPSCSPAGRGRALIRHAVFPTCCRVDVSSWATSLRRQRREGRYVADKCISLRQRAKNSAHLPRALAQGSVFRHFANTFGARGNHFPGLTEPSSKLKLPLPLIRRSLPLSGKTDCAV